MRSRRPTRHASYLWRAYNYALCVGGVRVTAKSQFSPTPTPDMGFAFNLVMATAHTGATNIHTHTHTRRRINIANNMPFGPNARSSTLFLLCARPKHTISRLAYISVSLACVCMCACRVQTQTPVARWQLYCRRVIRCVVCAYVCVVCVVRTCSC